MPKIIGQGVAILLLLAAAALALFGPPEPPEPAMADTGLEELEKTLRDLQERFR